MKQFFSGHITRTVLFLLLPAFGLGFLSVAFCAKAIAADGAGVADNGLKIYLGALLLSCLAGLVLAGVIFRLVLRNPVRQLLEVVRRLGKGDYRARANLPRLSGDLGELVNGVDDMARRLESHSEELLEAKQAADVASKAKNDFLASISHEIRTPMNAIIGMTYLVLKTDLNDRQESYIKKIQIAANTLLGIINDVLDFSKIEAGSMTLEKHDFVLEEVLNNAITLLAQTAENKGLELIFSISPDVPQSLAGDSLRLSQILSNLISNAIKFTSTGEVTLVCRLADHSDDSRRLECPEGNPVRLFFSVSDTGIGITPEHMETLFHPFSQADTSSTRVHGGTGLGLTITKSLIEKMGGEIHFVSQPGKGTTVSFSILLECSRPLTALPSYMSLSDLKVLVVDDNETARTILSELLANFKLLPTAIGSAKEAYAELLRAEKKGNPYRLVALDWHMPDISGLEAAEHIRSMGLARTPPIILVTAFGRSDLQKQAEKAGIKHIVFKPVNASRMFNAVLEAVETERRELAPEPEYAAAPSRGLRFKGLRVLLVEDNIINQQVAKGILEPEGVFVETADNGQIGVDILKRRPEDFHLVLMDLHMPVMDGYTATQVIRTELGLTVLPIIAMTAHTMSGERDACISAGMSDHVAKPIAVDKLFEALELWAPKAGYVRPSEDSEPLPHPACSEPEPVSRPASGEPGQDTPPLPVIAGFAVTRAVERLAGNLPIYINAVCLFMNSIPQHAETLEHAYAGNETEVLQRAAHTIKGLAATIGATDLAGEAAALEKDLDQDGFFPDHKRLCRLLDLLHDAQAAIAASGLCVESADQAKSAGDLDTHLEKLTALLEEDDANAPGYLRTHGSHFAEALSEQDMRNLTQAIQLFDYEAALEVLKALRG